MNIRLLPSRLVLFVILLGACCLSLVASSFAQTFSAADVNAVYPEVETLYLDLHRHPELSFQEQQTAAKLAERLRALGYQVTTGIGRTGVVAVMRNGAGPTVLLRTDMDALPVEEKTGLEYASHVTTKNAAGATVPVMHACGHDVHMSSWFGTAKLLATHKDRWHGTLVLIGQPAEEIGAGAAAMLKDGLFTRFPMPDFAVAIHDDSSLPAGVIGYTPGPALASSDTVTIVIHGKGGHGAMPQSTVDPVVIAARTVLALQTVVARENDPRDPAVITVGSIHGGTKENIIPDQVRLALTVRSYKPEVRKKLLAAIERIAKAEAAAANAPRPPEVNIEPGLAATVNDPALTNRLAKALRRSLGDKNVQEIPPKMVSEDFGEFAIAGVPSAMFHVGGVEPQRYAAAIKAGETLPSLHSALWAPDREATLKTAILTETGMVLELMVYAQSPSSNQKPLIDRNTDPLESTVSEFRISNATILDGLAHLTVVAPELSFSFEQPIAETFGARGMASQRLDLNLQGRRVREVLDELCRADPGFSWVRDGTIINVFPTKTAAQGGSYLLNRILPRLELRRVTNAQDAVFSAVNQLPAPPEQIAVAQFGGDISYSSPWTATIEAISVRRVFNQIAQHIGPRSAWIFGGSKQFRTITFYTGQLRAREEP